MNKLLPLVLVLLLGALLAWTLLFWEPTPQNTAPHQSLDLAQQPMGGDFTLTSAKGPVSLSDFRGKVVLVYFGYTWCPDICPLNLGYLTLALDKLEPEERERVQVLFISVDPGRDTPDRLREYTDYFAPDVLGLTGTAPILAETAALYGAAYRRGEEGSSALGYSVDHSAFTYLLDTSGKLKQTLDHATPPENIVAAIRSQLTTGESL